MEQYPKRSQPKWPQVRWRTGLAMAGVTRAHTCDFGALGRASVRAASRDHALDMLVAALAEWPAP